MKNKQIKKSKNWLDKDVKSLKKGHKRLKDVLAEITFKAAEQDAAIKARQEESDNALKAMIAATNEQVIRTSTQVIRTSAQVIETSAQVNETSAEVKKTTEGLKELQKQFGNAQNNNGKITEDYFYNSLSASMEFAGIVFDKITRNSYEKNTETSTEFDILMLNGNTVLIVECKNKAHESDLENLENKKLIQFRKLYPNYAHCKVYLALASFSFYPGLETKATERGIALLKQVGNIMKVEMDNLKAF